MSDVVNGDIEAQEEDKMVNGDEANLNESNTPIVKTRQFTYSKEELIAISKKPYCKKRPKCIDPDYVKDTGIWDLDLWINYKKPSKNLTPSNPTSARDHDLSAPGLINKSIRGPPRRVNGESESSIRSRKDPRDRVKEESQDDIVLSPQRRSFGTGCHIVPIKNEQPVPTGNQIQRNSVGKTDNHAHQQDRRDEQLLHRNENVNRRIGSGRLLNQRDKSTLEWSKSRDREEEIENRRSSLRFNNNNGNSGRYDYDRRSSNNNNRRYSHHDRRDREEEEPEWFSGGPTSQHDTIELKGFEEDMQDEEEEEPNARNNHTLQQYHQSGSESHEQNSGEVVAEHLSVETSHTKSNGVEGHDTGPKESQDFDIDEMFKFEGWKNIVSMGPENVTSIPVFTDSSSTSDNQNGGTSRFAQWFNVSRTETESPIDRLLQNVTFSSSYNAASQDSRRSSVQEIEGTVFHHNNLENGSHRIDPTVLGLRNHETFNNYSNNGHINVNTNGTENGDHGHNNSPVNKGKDLLNLLQKANININDLMQQQSSLPNVRFEHARSVEEIEAGLRSSPVNGSNHHHDGGNQQQQDRNGENSDFGRLILKAMSRRGNQMNNNPSSKGPVVIPLNMRPPQVHFPGKPSSPLDLLKEEDLLALNQQMIPLENCDPNMPGQQPIPGTLPVPRGQIPPWLQPKPIHHHANPNQKYFPNIVPENNDFNRLILKAMTRRGNSINNPNSKVPVILPQNVRPPPVHILGKPSSAMDLLKAEDLLALNQQMIPIENRNPNNIPGPPIPGSLPVPRGQIPPWLQPKLPAQHDNGQRYYSNYVHDNSAFMSLMNNQDYGAINNRAHLLKARTEEQILQQQHQQQQQQQQQPPLHVRNKPDAMNGNNVPKTATGNLSAFTPTSVIRKFASEKDKDAIRKKTCKNR